MRYDNDEDNYIPKKKPFVYGGTNFRVRNRNTGAYMSWNGRTPSHFTSHFTAPTIYPKPHTKRPWLHNQHYLNNQIARQQIHAYNMRMGAQQFAREQRMQARLDKERFLNATIPTKLIDRIEPVGYEVPDQIHFKKEKILKRKEEFDRMITAVELRIAPFIEQGQDSAKVPEDLWEGVQTFINNYKSFHRIWSENSHKLSNSQWRDVKKDLRSMTNIPFSKMDKEWDQICKELDALGKQKRFVYEEKKGKKPYVIPN